MTTEQSSIPNQNDRIMAALGNISVLLPLIGLMVPIFIWVTQKEKSKYVSFQALQAIVYQLVMIFAYFIGMGCYMVSFFSTFLTIPFAGESSGASASPLLMVGFIVPFLVMGAIFIDGAIFILYGIVAATMTLQGKDFRYFIIGNRVASFLEKQN
jgi:uncharacterized Tic20 family protein